MMEAKLFSMRTVYNALEGFVMRLILTLIIFITFSNIALADRFVLKFTADWCKYCKILDHQLLEKEFVKVTKQYKDLIVIDINKYPKIAKAYKVNSLPLLVVVDDANDANDEKDKKKIQIISRWVPAYKETRPQNRQSLLNWLKKYSPKKEKKKDLTKPQNSV